MSRVLRGKLWFLLVGMLCCVTALQGCGSGPEQESYDNEITVESVPASGAKVLINGDDFGVTPVTVKSIAPGAVLVELNKEG